MTVSVSYAFVSGRNLFATAKRLSDGLRWRNASAAAWETAGTSVLADRKLALAAGSSEYASDYSGAFAAGMGDAGYVTIYIHDDDDAADLVIDEVTIYVWGGVEVSPATQTSVDAVLADTNELQGDWANDGRLDVNLDAVLTNLEAINFALMLGQIFGIGATGNDTTHVHLPGMDEEDDELNDHLLVIKDVSTATYYTRWITDWVLSTQLATLDEALPFTPENSTDIAWVLTTRRDMALANVAHGGAAATLRLGSSSSTPALYVTNSNGDAAQFESTGGNGNGLELLGHNVGSGLKSSGGSSGVGVEINGGSSAGAGLAISTTSGDAINLDPTSGLSIFCGSGVTISGAITATNASNNVTLGTFTVTTNAIVWNAAWDAEVQSEVTDAMTAQGLTTVRADLLDKLNITGNVAGSAEVLALANNTSTRLSIPSFLERPDAGDPDIDYVLDLYVYDEAGHMEAPDSEPTLTVVNESGTDRSSNLSAISLVGTGHYRVTYTVADDHEIEQLRFEWTITEASQSRVAGGSSQVVDTTAVDFTADDRTDLQTVLARTDVATSTRAAASALPTNFTALVISSGGVVNADMVAISADATAADRLETMLDGTGGNVLTLGQLRINSTAAGGAIDIDNSAGPAIAAASSADDAVQFVSSGGDGHGFYVAGFGGGDGVHFIAGATGHGANFTGGSTSGDGLHAAAATLGDGFQLNGAGVGGQDLNATLPGMPTNFSAMLINSSGHVSRVTLVDTTTVNSDMRGTDGAYTGTPPTADENAAAVTAAHGTGSYQTATTTAVSDKTGFKLASDGLDSVSVAAPSGVATNFREMLVQLWRRFFKKSTLTESQLKTYADNGSTVLTTQSVTDDDVTQTQGDAS